MKIILLTLELEGFFSEGIFGFLFLINQKIPSTDKNKNRHHIFRNKILYKLRLVDMTKEIIMIFFLMSASIIIMINVKFKKECSWNQKLFRSVCRLMFLMHRKGSAYQLLSPVQRLCNICMFMTLYRTLDITLNIVIVLSPSPHIGLNQTNDI